MRKGSIYKIECLLNNKIYIGQTVQNPPIKRWLDHYKEINNLSNKLYLYRAIRTLGIENFTFQILETNIELSNLNKKEIEYIKKYNSDDRRYGYNLTKGGGFTAKSKIDEDKVKEIIYAIKTETEKSFVEIARIYDVSREMVSDINTGETWYFSNLEYPIRDNSKNKFKLKEQDVYDIYIKLKNKMSLTDIAKEYGVSVTNISNINNGITYKFLDEKSYPIYKPVNSKSRLDTEKIRKIINLLITHPEYTYSKIGEIVGVGRHTVSGINNGNLYLDIAKELGVNKYPIR